MLETNDLAKILEQLLQWTGRGRLLHVTILRTNGHWI